MEVTANKSKNYKEDLDWVRKAQKNDAKAFEVLLKKYHKSVYYMLLKMVYNHDDAEDLTQEAFTKAFASIKKFNAEYAFSTWLFRIATNNCIDFIRKKRIKTISIDNPYENDEGESMQFDIRDTALNPNEKLLKKQRKVILKKAITKLAAKYRTLIELRYFEELSYDEISDRLEIPLGTVKAQLFRARELLSDALKGMKEQM